MYLKDLQESHHQCIKGKKHQVRSSYNTGIKSSVWGEFIYFFMHRFYENVSTGKRYLNLPITD